MEVPGVGSGSGAGSGSATEEAAASDAAVLLAASETAGEEALRSRLRTTVYQVWVAQSSTWGAASQPMPSTASTSTAMPMPFFSFISRL